MSGFIGEPARSSTRKCEMGAVSNDFTCACRRLPYAGDRICRRSCLAGTERDVLHRRERDHAGCAVFAERFPDNQRRCSSRYRVRQYSWANLSRPSDCASKKHRAGQIATSGMLAKTSAIGGAKTFPALISIPEDMSHDSLRLGMSGSATAFSPKAGVIGLLASILVWVNSYCISLESGQLPKWMVVLAKPRESGGST